MDKYTQAKQKNQEVQKIARRHLSEKGYARLLECGSWLDFLADKPFDKLKLISANFCKWRFCPMCAWRKALELAYKISVMMVYIQAVHGKEFIMLSLTAPNVTGENLKREIARYNKAFGKMTRRKFFTKLSHGFIRKLEVTYNKDAKTYHPHFHVLIAVNRGYFNGGNYVKRDEWLEYWQVAMQDYSITQVDVRRAGKNKDSKDMSEAGDKIANEMAKYIAKSADYAQSDIVFQWFVEGLRGKRSITYSGLFKQASKMFDNDELKSYETPDNTEYYWRVVYDWSEGAYASRDASWLDEADKLFMARRGINVVVGKMHD